MHFEPSFAAIYVGVDLSTILCIDIMLNIVPKQYPYIVEFAEKQNIFYFML